MLPPGWVRLGATVSGWSLANLRRVALAGSGVICWSIPPPVLALAVTLALAPTLGLGLTTAPAPAVVFVLTGGWTGGGGLATGCVGSLTVFCWPTLSI